MAKCNVVVVCLNFILMVGAVNGVAFDYFMLVLQYSPATCSGGGIKCATAPVNRFTIHGLWPENFSNPIVCTGPAFDPSIPWGSIRNQLDTFWPNVKYGDDVAFWIHEWNYHGKCSNYNQIQYFVTTLNLHANPQYDLMPILNAAQFGPSPQAATHPIHDMARAIQVATGKWPSLKCQPKNPRIQNGWKQLHEIVLCFHNDGSTLIDCPQISINCGNGPDVMWF